MKTALAYLRVSTAKQVDKEIDPDGMSLPVQKEYAKTKAAELGAAIEEFYIDRGQSARTMRRDDLQRMIRRLREGERVDYVIVLSVNRLARDVGDFDRLWDDVITKSGAELISVLESFDGSPSGRFMAHVFAAKAEYDSAQTAERVRLGMARKAQIGGTVGRAPIGYLNTTRMTDGRAVKLVEVDDERAPFVQRAFHLYATGDWTLAELRDHLNTMGFRTRPGPKTAAKPLALSQLSRMLTNRYYVGDVCVKGVVYEGRHEPLVATRVFERVQEVLAAHLAGERQRVHHHFLKGLVFCDRCGSWMTLQLAKKRYLYFFCQGRAKGSGCDQPYLAVEAVEEQMLAQLRSLRQPIEDIDRAHATLVNYVADLRASRAADSARQEKALRKVRDERERLLRAYMAGAIEVDLLKGEQERIRRDIAAAESRLAVATAEHEDAERTFAEAAAVLHDPAGVWRALTSDQERRQFILTLFTRLKLDGPRSSTAELTPETKALVDGIAGARREYHRTQARCSATLDLRRFVATPENTNPPVPEHERVLLSAIWSG